MEDAWYDYWLYIQEENIAPIFVGEWGGFMEGDNLKWMEYFRQLIAEKHLHHTFWCYNANSGDTGGLVKDDFRTWDEEKYNFVKEVLWQTDDGKFIGLDHAVPLGVNGIALSDYTGVTITPAPVSAVAETTLSSDSSEQQNVSGQSKETGNSLNATDSYQETESDLEITSDSMKKSAIELFVVVIIIAFIIIILMVVVFVVKRWIDRRRTAKEEIMISDSGGNTVDRNETNTENTAEYFDNMMGIPGGSHEDD